MAKETRESFVWAMAGRYGTRLKRFFSAHLRNKADAPDLAQEVFLRLLRVEHHETIRNPEAYLFTVASHVLQQHTLRQANAPLRVDICDAFSELELISADDPEARADAQQNLEELQRVLKQLPQKWSTAFLLHRFAGLSIEQIGQQLGVSRPAAKKYLARALMHCQDALDGGKGEEDSL